MANSNEYMREYMLRRYHRRRAEAIVLLGGECVCCGTTENLEFDHVDRSLKQGDLAKLWSYSYSRFLRELDLCQLLCHDCHVEKTRIDLGVEHGGGLSGKMARINGRRVACPCELCVPVRREYNRSRR